MKTLALASLLIPLTLLVVCKTQKNGIQRISTDLYRVNSVEQMSVADRDTLKKAILDYYKIRDIKQERIVISRNDSRNKDGSVYNQWLQIPESWREGLKWKDSGQLPEQAIQIRRVLDKYAAR